MTNRWPSRIVAFTLWALAAMSATYWLLKVTGVSEAPVRAGGIGAETPSLDVQSLALALGPVATLGAIDAAASIPAPTPDAGARMRLLGVVAGRSSGGVALIAIDGQPPRPYRLGSQIDASHKLTRVQTRSATLSPLQPDGQAFTLELPSASAAAPPVAFGGFGANRPPGLGQSLPVPATVTRPGLAPVAAPNANATAIAPATDTEGATKD